MDWNPLGPLCYSNCADLCLSYKNPSFCNTYCNQLCGDNEMYTCCHEGTCYQNQTGCNPGDKTVNQCSECGPVAPQKCCIPGVSCVKPTGSTCPQGSTPVQDCSSCPIPTNVNCCSNGACYQKPTCTPGDLQVSKCSQCPPPGSNLYNTGTSFMRTRVTNRQSMGMFNR